MARVSDAERKQAQRQELDRARIERMGMDEAQRIGFRAQQAALTAYRRGLNPIGAFRREMKSARQLITHGMMAANLTGRMRVAKTVEQAAPVAMSVFGATAYTAALKVLVRRSQLTHQELIQLEEAHDAVAVRVLQKAEEAVEARLQSAILYATTEGMHIRDGIKELAQAFEASGITPDNSFTLEALFRTQTATAYAAGRWQAEQTPEVQEILWGYKYVTVGDDRVRPEHVGFEGVTLPKEDQFWKVNMPPNGWCCRCTTISLFDERNPSGPPSEVDVDGKMVQPAADKGFAVNFGEVLAV